jgi:hypothetical protein
MLCCASIYNFVRHLWFKVQTFKVRAARILSFEGSVTGEKILHCVQDKPGTFEP